MRLFFFFFFFFIVFSSFTQLMRIHAQISIKRNHSIRAVADALPIENEVMFDFALLTIECGQFVVSINSRWRIETRKGTLTEKLLPKSGPEKKDADQTQTQEEKSKKTAEKTQDETSNG